MYLIYPIPITNESDPARLAACNVIPVACSDNSNNSRGVSTVSVVRPYGIHLKENFRSGNWHLLPIWQLNNKQHSFLACWLPRHHSRLLVRPNLILTSAIYPVCYSINARKHLSFYRLASSVFVFSSSLLLASSFNDIRTLLTGRHQPAIRRFRSPWRSDGRPMMLRGTMPNPKMPLITPKTGRTAMPPS